uniref:F-box associated domain-containing protein n=1 Tax=Rhizophagus irregularis (strain DAOM 181602 / DAOM 197198 / MUCL 43194) TaxID=747089 RepID=U9UJY7_RHIID
MYLKLVLRNSSISELEELLIRCQYLDELYLFDYDGIDLNNLFRILTRSSPTNLFKFKFSFSQIDLDSLELFFENWKGRHPMILQFVRQTEDIEVLIEKYKSEGCKVFYINKFIFYHRLLKQQNPFMFGHTKKSQF